MSVAHDDDAVDDPAVTLTHTVSGGDYDTGVTVAGVEVTISDDDTPGLRVNPTELAIREGSSRDYRVRLQTQPPDEVTVMIGGAPEDVEVDPPTLTFTTGNWNRNQTVRVSVREDDDAQDDDDVTLTNTAQGGGPAADGGYDGVTGDSVTVSITDNDTPAVRVSPTKLTIPEGSSRDYTVALTTEPSDTVTVMVSGASGDVMIEGQPTLTFTANDWDPKSVTVSAREDDDAATDDTVTLTHEVAGAPEYADLEASDVTVEITENDEQFVTVDTGNSVNPTLLEIDEPQNTGDTATGAYTVELGTQPTGDVKVTVGNISGDVSVDKTSLTFTPDDWDAEQTVTVTVTADADAIPDAAVTLTHTVSGADYQGVTAAAVTVKIDEMDEQRVTLTGATGNALTIGEGMTGTYTLVLDTEPSATVTITGQRFRWGRERGQFDAQPPIHDRQLGPAADRDGECAPG